MAAPASRPSPAKVTIGRKHRQRSHHGQIVAKERATKEPRLCDVPRPVPEHAPEPVPSVPTDDLVACRSGGSAVHPVRTPRSGAFVGARCMLQHPQSTGLN
jgi:hypothetical protein